MNIKQCEPAGQIEEEYNDSEEEQCPFAFVKLADQLIRFSRMFFYDSPCYDDPERGLSIVITRVNSDTYGYLESCILSMGYKPIREAGPVRVVMFSSVREKEAFKIKFSNYYEKTLIDFKEVLMTENDYFRIPHRPTLGLHNEPSAEAKWPSDDGHYRDYFSEFQQRKSE